MIVLKAMVKTRSQSATDTINRINRESVDRESVDMDKGTPTHSTDIAGPPPCYLAWGRFMTMAEYYASSSMSITQVNKMMGFTKKPT